MAVLTGTLTVNAAFLREIKEDNRRLRELFDQTAEMCRRPCRGTRAVRQIVDHFWELRDQLALHFTLEDAYGYFEDALMESPRLSGEAERLHAQHESLFLEMCQLVDLAEEVLYHERHESEGSSVTAGFHAFQARFERHERAENELIRAAFDDDIGVGD
jgi:hypothetical protein